MGVMKWIAIVGWLFGVLIVATTVHAAPAEQVCDARCQMATQVYSEILGRAPDPGGLEHHMRGGLGDRELRIAMCHSPEGRRNECGHRVQWLGQSVLAPLAPGERALVRVRVRNVG